MKRNILSLCLFAGFQLGCLSGSGFPYQAILRNVDGTVIANQEVVVRFSLLTDSEGKNVIYKETHETATGADGEVVLEIGNGKADIGDFDAINWSEGALFLQTELNYGNGFNITGVQELLSTPYSIYSESATALRQVGKDGTTWQLCVDDYGEIQVIPFPKGYSKLVFQDEFNGTGLPDSTKWSYEEGFVRNSEMQYYTVKRKENVFQKDGYLTIRCINNDTLKNETGEVLYNDKGQILNEHIGKDGKKYYITSGSIRTKGKGDWKYCRIEIRIKLPSGSGVWPAIWMMPTDNVYGYWPNSGEIDIMEYIGNEPAYLHCASHFYNKSNGNKYVPNTTDKDATVSWHILAIEWHADRLEWYCDGKLRYRYKNPNTNWGDWPFDQRFHAMLNFAFGGGWGGQNGFDVNILPLDYKVDYVRVFQ